MRVVGIVTEYNPLHNGHEYQIKQAREKFKADYIIVLMTGNFNQRGMPAIISKERRAEFAIQAGADIVYEFPTSYALEDVPIFSYCAVSMLNQLGVVTDMLFSSELGLLDDLVKMSEIITSAEYDHMLASLNEIDAPSLKRKEAFMKLGFENYADVINDPNNLFAVYFIAALKRTNSSIKPVTIKRIGDGYLDSRIHISGEKVYASATAVRNYLENVESATSEFPLIIKSAVPTYVYDRLLSEWRRTYPITREDFWLEIRDSIEQLNIEKIEMISGMNLETARSVKDAICHVNSYEGLVKHLKLKHPHVNFHRRLFRILTRQFQKDIDSYIATGPALYSAVLAHSTKGAELLKYKKENGVMRDSLVPANESSQKQSLANQLECNTSVADLIYMRVVEEKYGGMTI